MKPIPKVAIRYGALHDSITVDGVTFDRSRMTRPERSKLTRMAVAGLTMGGYFRVSA